MFAVRPLEGTILERGSFDLQQSEADGIFTATVSVAGAQGLKAAYVELAYDAEQLTPVGVDPGGLFAGLGTPIVLTVEPEPGTIQHGSVLANWPDRAGFDGEGTVATFKFAGSSGAVYTSPQRAVTSVPHSDKAKSYLNYNAKSSVFLWYYVNPGDYDQNGEVGITDLTPLGANFNAEGPFGVTSARAVIDGDGNDVINIADITPIGLNFGNRIEGFNVHGSIDPTDYPASNTGPNGSGSRQVGTRQFSASKGGGALRKYWELVLDAPIINGRYWLRPHEQSSEGTPSQLTAEHQQQWHLQTLHDYTGDKDSCVGLSLALINGRPAIVYGLYDIVDANSVYLFQAATDDLGEQWNSPAPAITVGLSQYTPRLVEINGLPSFAWINDATGSLRFIQASDHTGQYWQSPTVVENTYLTSHQLAEFNDRPVACYRSGGLSVAVSIDSAGGTWMPPVTIYPTPGQWGQSMDAIALPGGVGTVTNDVVTNALVYVYAAIDGTAVTAAEPVEILPGGTGSNLRVAIGVAQGNPFVVSKRGQGLLYYSYAHDPIGNSWSPLELTGLEGDGDRMGVGWGHDAPWVCYFDVDTRILHSGYAAVLGGESWENAPVVADYTGSGGNVVNSISMCQVGVHPAVAFHHGTEDAINYAVFY